MNFQDAEKTYKDLKVQHDSSKLSDSTFEAEVGKLRMQDAQGRWWQIGVQTGEWYMHDGQKWNKAKPPVAATPLSEPAPSPEITAVIPRLGATPKAAATPKAEPAPKKNSGSGLPARLFSSKPAGRTAGGGLSRNTLIAIIAGVAVVCIVLAVVGYLVAQGPLGLAKAATATPTRPSLVLPTLPPPTLPPKPTDAPLPPPTPVVTTTIALPPTATATRAAARATATPTKKPAVATTPTLSAPPGVYVLKLETDPAKIDVGDGSQKPQVGFKLTLLNTTGGMQTFYKWFVGVFQCPEQCQGDKAFTHTWGTTGKVDVSVGTGTVEVTTYSPVTFGQGACEYIAVPYYQSDPNNTNPLPFLKTNGQPLYYAFKVCQ